MVDVSIIIPVYGVEKYIEECLVSVFSQTYTSYECILVDDCGKDNSIEIAERLIANNNLKNFKIIRREKNGGLSAARNSGLKHATGDYVYFLDSDDKLYPTALASLFSYVKKYPGVDMVVGNAIRQDQANIGLLDDKSLLEYSSDQEYIRTQLLSLNVYIESWNKLIRRSFIENHHFAFPEGLLHEDVLWCFNLQKHIHSIAFSKDYSYWYRCNNIGSIMNMKDKTKRFFSYVDLYEMMAPNVQSYKEYCYVSNLLAPMIKVYNWGGIKTFPIFKKIAETIVHLGKQNIKYDQLITQLYIWYLPCRIINNSFFETCYNNWKYKIACANTNS